MTKSRAPIFFKFFQVVVEFLLYMCYYNMTCFKLYLCIYDIICDIKEETDMKTQKTLKTALCLALCFLFMFSFAACKKSETASAENSSGNPVNMDETVSVEMPLELVDEEYRSDLDGFCKKYGYESASLSSDGKSVNVVVNEFNYKLKMTNRGMDAIKGIYSVTEDSKAYPYVTDIESYDDKDFKEVVLLVNKKKYEADASKDLAAYTIGQSCLRYQAYSTSNDYECKVTVKDSKTKKVLDTKTYNELVF